MFSEREKSKQFLNEYLKNTLNVSSIETKKPDINVIEDIESIIVNRNQESNSNNNYDQSQGKNNYRKINPSNKNKNNNMQLNENDIREYAMDMPMKSNFKVFKNQKSKKNRFKKIKKNINFFIKILNRK